MSDPPGHPPPFDLESFNQARWERNAYLGCAALIVYEYLLLLDSEVEFFWKQRWSLAKVLFIWSRYYSLAFNVVNAVIFMQPRPSYRVTVGFYLFCSPFPGSLNLPILICFGCYRCNTFFHWQNTGASLQVITTHLILQLRLYAMYGSSHKILALFVGLIIGEALAMGLVFGIPNPKLIGTNEPFLGNFICADADPLDGSHWVLYYWGSALVVEGILLCLALIKAWQHRKAAHGSTIMQELSKDSVVYFFTIFWTYLLNLILWYYNRITLDELGTSFAFVIASIFANRLLVTVRANHYRTVTDVDTYMPSVNAIKFNHTTVSTTGNIRTFDDTASLELTPFNERTGV